jgi:hypothetical protein
MALNPKLYTILKHFERRGLSRSSAESFNAKIKAFRNQFRRVRKVDFCINT